MQLPTDQYWLIFFVVLLPVVGGGIGSSEFQSTISEVIGLSAGDNMENKKSFARAVLSGIERVYPSFWPLIPNNQAADETTQQQTTTTTTIKNKNTHNNQAGWVGSGEPSTHTTINRTGSFIVPLFVERDCFKIQQHTQQRS